MAICVGGVIFKNIFPPLEVFHIFQQPSMYFIDVYDMTKQHNVVHDCEGGGKNPGFFHI